MSEISLDDAISVSNGDSDIYFCKETRICQSLVDFSELRVDIHPRLVDFSRLCEEIAEEVYHAEKYNVGEVAYNVCKRLTEGVNNMKEIVNHNASLNVVWDAFVCLTELAERVIIQIRGDRWPLEGFYVAVAVDVREAMVYVAELLAAKGGYKNPQTEMRIRDFTDIDPIGRGHCFQEIVDILYGKGDQQDRNMKKKRDYEMMDIDENDEDGSDVERIAKRIERLNTNENPQ